MFRFFCDAYDLAGRHRRCLTIGIVFIVLQNLASLVTFAGVYQGFSSLGHVTTSAVIIMAAIMVGALLLYFVSNWQLSRYVAGVFFRIFHDYRLEVGERLKRAPMGYFSDTHLSALLSSLTSVMRSLENYSHLSFSFLFNGLSLTVFMVIGMFSMSWKVGVMTTFFVLVVWLLVAISMRLSEDNIEREHEMTASFIDALVDGVRGTSVLRTFPERETNAVIDIQSAVDRTSDEQRAAKVRSEERYVVLNKVFAAFLNIASVAVVLYACVLTARGEIKLPQALTLSVVGFMLFKGLLQLSDGAFLMVKNPSSLRYLKRVLTIPELSDGPVTKAPVPLDIVFENVTFGYDANKPVIRDLSFRIAAGSKTAIVGPSGAGKSTIINLLSRFYDVDQGRITIGGVALPDFDVKTLLSLLSLVFQDVYLFNDTVRNNIRFAKPEASDEEVIAAARQARCHDFITALPNGYDTLVGEGGARFSGGEKQRISIARALLKDAPIILLDEATSSIDPENEYEILQAIDALTKGKTVVTIAHRLSTVQDADQILVIADGTLVDSGTHDTLMARDSLYKRFITAREKAAKWRLDRAENA